MRIETLVFIGDDKFTYILEKGKIYHGYLSSSTYQNVYWIIDCANEHRGFSADLFVTLAEFRKKQIKDILD